MRQRVRELPEDASYYDRVHLGELIVGRPGDCRREVEAEQLYERLAPAGVDMVIHQPTDPEEVINAAFLVDRVHVQKFEDAVEDLGRELAGRVRLRLRGPLAPYDFVPEG